MGIHRRLVQGSSSQWESLIGVWHYWLVGAANRCWWEQGVGGVSQHMPGKGCREVGLGLGATFGGGICPSRHRDPSLGDVTHRSPQTGQHLSGAARPAGFSPGGAWLLGSQPWDDLSPSWTILSFRAAPTTAQEETDHISHKGKLRHRKCHTLQQVSVRNGNRTLES